MVQASARTRVVASTLKIFCGCFDYLRRSDAWRAKNAAPRRDLDVLTGTRFALVNIMSPRPHVNHKLGVCFQLKGTFSAASFVVYIMQNQPISLTFQGIYTAVKYTQSFQDIQCCQRFYQVRQPHTVA